MRIKCDSCGFETDDGKYDEYVGPYVDKGVLKQVRLRGDHPYTLGGTHVCDRFEYGTFRTAKLDKRKQAASLQRLGIKSKARRPAQSAHD